MTDARLVAQAVALLGPLDGPVAIVGRAGRVSGVRVAHDDEVAAGAVCVFLGEAVDPPARRARLDATVARLAPGARLVVVDHNQPRTWWRRALGCGALALRGFGPARARHGVALELRDRGVAIERLVLAAGERAQLVVARRP